MTGQLRLTFNDGEALLSHPSDYAIWNGEGSHSWSAARDRSQYTAMRRNTEAPQT